MIEIVNNDGRSIEEGIKDILRRVVSNLDHKSGKIITNALLWTTRNHFQTIYPDSNNFSPNKVQKDELVENGNTGAIDIYTKGINRNYHDVTIKPIRAKALTIPIHRSAYGKTASQFQDLFMVKKKDGRAFLAMNDGKNLTFMFRLAKSAFQKQDDRLMPKDETYKDNIASRIQAYIQGTSK